MELIEAVINLIEKVHNNSPVNNILDLPSLLSLRWKSIGKWLCPNGIKKNKKAEHLHLGHAVQHKAPSSGSAWRRHPRAAQDDSHLPLTLEAVVLDWTPGQTRGCDSRAGTSRAVEKSALMKPQRLVPLPFWCFQMRLCSHNLSWYIKFRPQIKPLEYLVYID